MTRASYLLRYCYFAASKSFAAYLAAAVAGRLWAALEAEGHRRAQELARDLQVASVFQFDDPSC